MRTYRAADVSERALHCECSAHIDRDAVKLRDKISRAYNDWIHTCRSTGNWNLDECESYDQN